MQITLATKPQISNTYLNYVSKYIAPIWFESNELGRYILDMIVISAFKKNKITSDNF